jgi:hypothetical protein
VPHPLPVFPFLQFALNLLPGLHGIAFGTFRPAALQFFGVEYVFEKARLVLLFPLFEPQFELFTLRRGRFRYKETSQQPACLDHGYDIPD